jgi:hypothetical protein
MQALAPKQRRLALLNWQIELWRSWRFYLCEMGIFLGTGVLLLFVWEWCGLQSSLRFLAIVAALLGTRPLIERFLYLPRGEILRRIVQQIEPHISRASR